MDDQVNCPFCHWHRWKDTKKGAVDFDPLVARRLLAEHVHDTHHVEFEDLMMEFQNTCTNASQS